MRAQYLFLVVFMLLVSSCSKSNNCDRNQAYNKMLALGKVQARLAGKSGESGMQLAARIGSESGIVSELIAQEKYNEACVKAKELEDKWGLDLAGEEKGMLTIEQLEKDGGKGSGTCSLADAAKKQMEIHGLLQKEVDAGRMSSDVFREFAEDTKLLADYMTSDPSKACELLERVRAKHKL